MPDWCVGDRIAFGDRSRTLGLAAKQGAKRFAITTGDLQRFTAGPSSGGAIPSYALLEAIELKISPPRDSRCAIGGLCPLESVLDETVFRFHPECGRVQGLVTALRGAVRMRSGERDIIVQNLVEIRFDETIRLMEASQKVATPRLESADAGSLVTRWDGKVIGLMVGGSGLVGYVAPVASLLEARKLVHIQVKRTAGTPYKDFDEMLTEAEAGIASFGAELAREPNFLLDELREAA